MVRNKNLKTVCYFSRSEVTLNEQEKQVSHLAGESGGGEATPVKFCQLEFSQNLDIVFQVFERPVTVKTSDNNKWKQMDNIFYKTRLFCSSHFLIKESDYILSDIK